MEKQPTLKEGLELHGSEKQPSTSDELRDLLGKIEEIHSEEFRKTLSRLIEDVAKIEKESRTDSLTGLLNRAGFLEEVRLLEAIFHRERKNGMRKASTLLVMDLDGFKEVNDSCGHACGDRCLKLISEKVQGVLREADIFARVGGDEFSIYLAQYDEKGALLVAEKVRLIIETEVTSTLRNEFPGYDQPHKKEEDKRKVSASIGMLAIDEYGASNGENMLDDNGNLLIDKIMKYADYIAYVVKAAGKRGDFTLKDAQGLDVGGKLKNDFLAGKTLPR